MGYMETLTIIFLCLSVGLFLARYALKHGGVDFLCACVSMCAFALSLKDPSIPIEDILIYTSPLILIIMLTLSNLMFGGNNDKY